MNEPIVIAVRITESRATKGIWIAAPIQKEYLEKRSIFFIGQGLSPSAALRALGAIYKATSDRDILPLLVEGKQR